MIKIISNDKNVIYYECDCGVKGKCFIKPAKVNSALVFDISCPNCLDTERVTVLQYSSEVWRKLLTENINSANFFWAPTFNEEL